MTLVFTVDTEFNNPDAPYLKVYDPIEDRNGSLFLWDAGKSPLVAVPVNNQAIPNLLAGFSGGTGNAFEFIQGASSQAEHDAYVKKELSARGGIHFITSQARATDLSGTETAYYLRPNAVLKQKLYDKIMTNGSPNLFISVWNNVTRHVTKVDGICGYLAYVAGNTTDTILYLQQDNATIIGVGSTSSSLSKLNLTAKNAAIVGQPNFHQANIKDYRGAGINNTRDLKVGGGRISPWGYSITSNQAVNACPSHIVYRIYIEDLNLSGRTFDQVRAIDEAEHAKAFAVGGRFHGDTWSNPATLLP